MLSTILVCMVLAEGYCSHVPDDDFKKVVLEEIGSLKAKVAYLEHKLASSEAENHSPKKHIRQAPNSEESSFPEQEVAFSASVSQHIKNLTAHQPIVFGTTVTNIGKYYNNTTGVFYVPVRGTYLFYVNILSEANNNIETELIVNGNMLAEIYSGAGRFHGAGSNLVIVRLNPGDNVWVKVHAAYSTDMSVHCCWSTFSGYLLRQVFNNPAVIG